MSDDENIKSSFICTIKGNILDSNYDDIDEAQCFILHFADIFYAFNFGHLCTTLLFLIIIISIFGGMKEHYRWFLLNQGIWDFLSSIKYFCDSDLYYYTTAYEFPKCDLFWFAGEYTYLVPLSPGSENGYLYTGIKRILEVYITSVTLNLPYSALFLLSASRIFALFFSNFYEKFTKKRRLFYILIIFNLLNLILNFQSILNILIENYIHDLHRRYGVPPLAFVYRQKDFKWPFNCSNINCFYETDTLLSIAFKTNEIMFYVIPAVTYFYMLFSIIASAILIIRIGIQAKFQLKHNRRDFFISLRISIVIFFQTFLLAILFAISFISTIPNLLISIFGVKVQSAMFSCPPNSSCIDFTLPKWIDGQYGLQSNAVESTIRELRILFECFFILFIMVGYQEVVKASIKFCYSFLRNPEKAFYNFKAATVSSRVVTLSLNSRK